jgi:outer membrane protein TolC
MVGLELNLPLRRARRAAALDEAEAALAEARSVQAGLGDQLRLAAIRAFERLAESEHALAIFRDRTLPAARDRVASARASFEAGQSDFSTLIDAERGLRDAELGHEEVRVALSRRRAELARAVGAGPEGALP